MHAKEFIDAVQESCGRIQREPDIEDPNKMAWKLQKMIKTLKTGEKRDKVKRRRDA